MPAVALVVREGSAPSPCSPLMPTPTRPPVRLKPHHSPWRCSAITFLPLQHSSFWSGFWQPWHGPLSPTAFLCPPHPPQRGDHLQVQPWRRQTGSITGAGLWELPILWDRLRTPQLAVLPVLQTWLLLPVPTNRRVPSPFVATHKSRLSETPAAFDLSHPMCMCISVWSNPPAMPGPLRWVMSRLGEAVPTSTPGTAGAHEAGSCHLTSPQPSSCQHSLFFLILWLSYHFPIHAVHGK